MAAGAIRLACVPWEGSPHRRIRRGGGCILRSGWWTRSGRDFGSGGIQRSEAMS